MLNFPHVKEFGSKISRGDVLLLHFLMCEQVYKTLKRLPEEGSHFVQHFVSTSILLFCFVTQCNSGTFWFEIYCRIPFMLLSGFKFL